VVAVAASVTGAAPEDGGHAGRPGEARETGASCGISFFLRKRRGTGLLAGMWEFPGVQVADAGRARGAALELVGELELDVLGPPVELDAVAHAFTHLKVRYRPFVLWVSGVGSDTEGRWLGPEELSRVPLPVAQERIAQAAIEVVRHGPQSL